MIAILKWNISDPDSNVIIPDFNPKMVTPDLYLNMISVLILFVI